MGVSIPIISKCSHEVLRFYNNIYRRASVGLGLLDPEVPVVKAEACELCKRVRKSRGVRPSSPHLHRQLGLFEAVSANMLEMIGVGPFLTIPLILSTMNGPQAMLGWLLGAVVAVCDGLVWAELGAAMPGSGGPVPVPV